MPIDISFCCVCQFMMCRCQQLWSWPRIENLNCAIGWAMHSRIMKIVKWIRRKMGENRFFPMPIHLHHRSNSLQIDRLIRWRIRSKAFSNYMRSNKKSHINLSVCGVKRLSIWLEASKIIRINKNMKTEADLFQSWIDIRLGDFKCVFVEKGSHYFAC